MPDTQQTTFSSDPRQPIAEQTVQAPEEHQLLADRIKSVLHGAWQYLMDFLPEHGNKDNALNAVKAAYDNALTVVREDAAAALEVAEKAAEDAGHAAVQAVESDLGPTTSASGQPSGASAPASPASTSGSVQSESSPEVPPTKA
jgi:outer membrane protein TolC